MQISPIGLAICAGLLVDHITGRGIVELVASLTFRATVLITLSYLGSFAPLI